MYRVEVKPGVGFSHVFGTKIEALIFIRDLSEACLTMGVKPFECEVIRVREDVNGEEESCDEDENVEN